MKSQRYRAATAMRRRVRACLCVLPAVLALNSAQAQLAEQTINLSSGWNAVWLEVSPTYTNGHQLAGVPMSPVDVFGIHPAVKTVTTPRPLAGLAEFFENAPTGGVYTAFNQEGWAQWHSPTGLVDDLSMIEGNRPYIIEASASASITVRGRASFFRPTWTPDRFNLVGFAIDTPNAPTFRAFFQPESTRHPVEKVYRLNAGGSWSVVSPEAVLRNNEAYWVFSRGPSDYMGPVSMSFGGMAGGELNFGGPIDVETVGSGVSAKELDLEEVVFSNAGTNPVTPRFALQSNLDYPAQIASDLTLHEVEPSTNLNAYVFGSVLGSDFYFGDGAQIAANSSGYLTIGAERDWSVGRVDRVKLYRVRTGGGTMFWLPVRVQQNDLQVSGDLQPAAPGGVDPQLAGLWMGDVIAREVTSLVEDGAPVRPAASTLPLRVLVHVGTNGVARLLSQVTVMQTKTADPDVTPEQVLVVDPAQIPYFEGVKQRHGKRVGVRLESIAYDMPRSVDTNTQSALISVTNLASEAAVRDYLESQTIRPESLLESYHRVWPLEGYWRAGQTVQTAVDAPLRLDPFHRSNPFRHAYHQKHPRGPSITRHLEMTFEENQPVPGVLRGSYTETLDGVIKDTLVVRGAVALRQVSAVAVLEGVE